MFEAGTHEQSVRIKDRRPRFGRRGADRRHPPELRTKPRAGSDVRPAPGNPRCAGTRAYTSGNRTRPTGPLGTGESGADERAERSLRPASGARPFARRPRSVRPASRRPSLQRLGRAGAERLRRERGISRGERQGHGRADAAPEHRVGGAGARPLGARAPRRVAAGARGAQACPRCRAARRRRCGAGEALDTAAARIDFAIHALRRIIADLRPAALDDLGLEPALETLVERVRASAPPSFASSWSAPWRRAIGCAHRSRT